ncbi:lethal(2) giant larvae protein isoform X3 [Halyomorpha halys]|uniref:lethal(2) giant larvae protein isoform X3 n=1 Tax=Halyomorpha halys TaxID=286706 RepID=UPI0006D4CAFD|nr:protein lethal(2) giant larvae isoform X3 [Halyomorpha halys]
MLKFIRGKGQQPSAERVKLQKELFAFRKTVQHGFPNKPTCLAWDPVLRLMAIGTATGAIKVLGRPGVEFYGHHASSDISVTKIIFIPNQGRVVTLCEDNSLHLWEINDNILENVKSHTVEGKLNKVSALCLEGSEEHLLIGTEGGNVYLLHLSTFEMSSTVIYQDVVMQNVPEDYKINPGAVDAMAIQPDNPDNLLIGYERGLMVLWNMKKPAAEQTCISMQGVESVDWKDNETFVSSHNDGSYMIWSTKMSEPIKDSTTVYGPFPCKKISKLIAHGDMIIFSGGMQRASYSDRNTISVLDGDRHVVFDFTSKVIDFFVTNSNDDTILMVLAEEELCAIQLNDDSWPMLPLPYLVSLHASAVTCSTYVSNLPQELWDDILEVGKQQIAGHYSTVEWPIDGGELEEIDEPKRRDLFLTGHEDGSVRLWDAASVAMVPLLRFSSTKWLVAGDDDLPHSSEEETSDDWPPFKKVGSFDPYSDDPRLAVKKVALCSETGVLAVAGTAGHVILAKLSKDGNVPKPQVVTMNILSSREGFVWKGYQALSFNDSTTSSPGFACTSLLQLHPPAAVTALALHSPWGLVAAGTAHGVALYDFQKMAPVTVKSTLSPLDMSGSGEGPISRRKSFKKSLRESFRRLRKGRSQRGDKRGATTTAATASPPPQSPEGSEIKPVERAIEARPADDGMGSMVRCITFARTYIISVQNLTPTLWVGTNNGTVYVFTLAIPGGEKRKEESVACQLGKEIQLKHRAPVINISIMDGNCNSVDTSRLDNHPPPHKVLISSEEQIKVFTVPQLKPVTKLKLTACEGARVRRTILATFTAGSHVETCLLCLTNLGDVVVLALPDLRRQVNAAVIRREDINGISSLSFTEKGEALYLHSSSELQRVSLSTNCVTIARCRVELPPGARPPLQSDNTSQSSESSEASSSSSSSSSSADSQQPAERREGRPEAGDANRTEIKENGVSETSTHDLTLSSVDITIDSVKDHLTNNVSSTEDSRTVVEVTRNESHKIESTLTKTTVISTNELLHVTSPPTEST